MKNLKFFKGIRFRAKNLQDLIAPPYDVFNDGDELDIKLRSNPSNIVHIQKPLGDEDVRYINARDTFYEYIKNGTIMHEKAEGLYIIRQSWGNKSRTGLIALVRLDDSYSRIKPHEKTKDGPIEERLKLTQATDLNIGCIFLVFADEDSSISKLITSTVDNNEHLYDFDFPENIKNEVAFSSNQEILDKLQEKVFYIADGHHRYQTMINHRDQMRKTNKKDEDAPYEYTMMFLVPDTEITILPYDRLIRNIDSKLMENLISDLEKEFTIETIDSGYPTPEKGKIGIFIDGKYHILTPREDLSSLLDTQVLNQKILTPYLGMDEQKLRGGEYLHFLSNVDGNESLVDKVKAGEFQAAVLLHETSFEEIKNISNAGEVMPRKSTFFYPKIPTGIVIRKITD